jgi:hypothetical protein
MNIRRERVFMRFCYDGGTRESSRRKTRIREIQMAPIRSPHSALQGTLLVVFLALAGPGFAQIDEAPSADDVQQTAALTNAPTGAPAAAGTWSRRADSLIAAIANFEMTPADADQFFLELDTVLAERVRLANERMRDARSPTEPIGDGVALPQEIETIADLHDDVRDLYAVRLRLLDYLTPGLHLEVMGTDVTGMSAFGLELQFIGEQMRFRALNLPAAAEEFWRRIQIAPLPVLWKFVKFLLIIIVFRWWRQWLPETLRRMHISLAEIRPRSAAIVRKIRMVWYIGQVRKPLEWMLLAEVLFSMADMPGVNFIIEIVSVIVHWILLGWFSVSLLNAVAARGDAGLTGEDAAVRLKSLRLIAAWLVLLGLGLSLAESLAGIATLHAWVWRLYQVLALPVLIVLLSWWRQPIFERLSRVSESTDTVNELLEHRNGVRSYRNAARGGAWLIANALRRAIMRQVLRVGGDQGIGLTSSSADASTESQQAERRPIAEETRTALLSGESGYERHARPERRRIVSRVASNPAGIVAVVGERGVGKSMFLRSLRKPLDDRIVIVDARAGTYDELMSALGAELEIDDVTPQSLTDRLIDTETRIVAIDSVHRLVRPVIGGQAELIKLKSLIENTQAKVLWLFSVDCYAWQFLKRARADQSTINEVVELPAWSEEQLGQLLDQRNEEAGIEPDFSKVTVPDEFMVTTLDSAEARSKASLYRMLWMQSAGNPVIALQLWADCLYYDEDDRLVAGTPWQQVTRDLDTAMQSVLLVLRSIALAEEITKDDITDNLRLPAGAVSSAIHYCQSRDWIEEYAGRYRLNMNWFRTITRVLTRQNLLAR